MARSVLTQRSVVLFQDTGKGRPSCLQALEPQACRLLMLRRKKKYGSIPGHPHYRSSEVEKSLVDRRSHSSGSPPQAGHRDWHVAPHFLLHLDPSSRPRFKYSILGDLVPTPSSRLLHFRRSPRLLLHRKRAFAQGTEESLRGSELISAVL